MNINRMLLSSILVTAISVGYGKMVEAGVNESMVAHDNTNKCYGTKSLSEREIQDISKKLRIAAEYGYTDQVDGLLMMGADPNYKPFFRDTTVFVAYKNNHFDIVGKLIKSGAKISDKENRILSSELLLAAEKGNVEEVKPLLLIGASLTFTRNYYTENSLITAIQKDHTEVVKAILNHPGIETFDRYSESINEGLAFAAHRGNAEIVKLLLDKGADVNHTSHYLHPYSGYGRLKKYTALIAAAEHGYTEIVITLLNQDNFSYYKGEQGKLARNSAADNNHKQLALMIRNYKKNQSMVTTSTTPF